MKEMDERKQEGELHLLGGSTVYKQDYAPEVLEALRTSIKEMIIGYGLIARNSPVSARLPDNRISLRFISIISPT